MISESPGRVAIVTGAGQGLGRAYAEALARRGIAVLVEDAGVGPDGRGGEVALAESVAEAIRRKGGRAVACATPVGEAGQGQAIIETAMDAFGRIDILINNAGFLRDRSFAKMSADDSEAIVRVHLLGAMHVTRAAWPLLCAQGHGRIVLTTSSSGLWGAFGQANYDAAKLGLVGFMNALKLEGSRHNVLVNTIAPLAATRLGNDIFPPDALARMHPDWIVALVLWLASDACTISGETIEAGAGRYARVRLTSTATREIAVDGQVGPEQAGEVVSELMTLDTVHPFPNAADAVARLLLGT